MEILEQLELVDVQFEDNNQKVVCVFLDESKGEIREVSYNKQIFDQQAKKFIPDEAKAEKAEKWCQEHFGLSFDEMGQAIGIRKDVYCYDTFNSVYEVMMIEKHEEDMVGQILTVQIVNALDDGKKISLQYEYEGKLYESKMQYANYLEIRQEWFPDPIKRQKQYDKFKEKFGISVENIADMIGKEVLVEVKKAMGKYIYSEVKPFAKPKKKGS